jgi:hypothetical protein
MCDNTFDFFIIDISNEMLICGRDIKLPIYKILNENMTHNGYVYKLGTNTDSLPFNPKGSCRPGGLYFADVLTSLISLIME